MNRKDVVGDDVVAGARVVNAGHKAVDIGCEVVDEHNTLGGAATSPSMSSLPSFPSAATSFSLISCPLPPLTSTLCHKLSSSLVLLL